MAPPYVARKTAVAVLCAAAICLGAGCRQEPASSLEITTPAPAVTTAADMVFTDAAISMRIPSDWTIAPPQRMGNSEIQDEGVSIRKGSFVVSAKGATVLQASGVIGGRLPEYLKSGILDVGCIWSETNSGTLTLEETKLQNGITLADYYLDASRLDSAARSCLSTPLPASGFVYVGSSSGLQGELLHEQSLIRFYTAAPAAVYVKGDAALLAALKEMMSIASTFRPVFDPGKRSNGESIVTALHNAGFAYSSFPSENSSYPGYENGSFFSCSPSDGDYSDYVSAFTESIPPADRQKLLNTLATDGWTKCRTADRLTHGFDNATKKETSYTFPVDVYTRNGEILNVIPSTHSGNATVVVPWALRRTTANF